MARIQVTYDWDAIKADPVEFARKLLKGPDGNPFDPFEAQQQILRGIKRRTVVNTGRQFSKTTTMGIYTAFMAMTHSNWNICIIAPSLEQARIMFGEVEHHFVDGLLKSMVYGKIKQYPFPVIKLTNGTTITARGANSPQFIRGNRFHLIICDEAAFIKDKVITDAVEPTMTVTGKVPGASLILTSTPWGSGPFREWYTEAHGKDADPDLACFHFTSYDNPHADRKFLENVKKRYGEASLLWRTEYLGIFPDDDMSVFPYRDIEWAMDNWPTVHEAWVDGKELRSPAPFPIAAKPGHSYVQGSDLANLRDFFVSSVADISNLELAQLVRMDRFQRKGWAAVKLAIKGNFDNYNSCPTLIDATTLAESVVEEVVSMGVYGAEGYKFSGNTAKYEVVQELVRVLNEHRLLLPPDPDIRDELRFFEYEILPSKRLRMEASRGHDDIVTSLSLVAHKMLQPRRAGFFASVDVSPTHWGSKAEKPKRELALPRNPRTGKVDILFGE